MNQLVNGRSSTRGIGWFSFIYLQSADENNRGAYSLCFGIDAFVNVIERQAMICVADSVMVGADGRFVLLEASKMVAEAFVKPALCP